MSGSVPRARAALATFGFVVTGAVVSFGITLSVTHGAGAGEAGELFQLMAVLAITTTACTLGADVALVRTLPALTARGQHRDLVAAVRTAVPAPLLTASLVALAAVFATWTGTVQIAPAPVVIALGLGLVAGTGLNVCFGALRGIHRVPWFSALQNVVLPSLRWIGVLIALWLGTSLTALSLAWCLPVLVCLGLAIAVLGRLWPRDAPDLPETGPGLDRRAFWGFASARGATAMVEAFLEWIDVVLVGVFLGPVAAGVYGVVNRCVRAGTMLEHTARMVTGPGISAAMAVGDRAATGRIYSVATAVLVSTAWPLYITLIAHGATVLSFFGTGFHAGAAPMAVVSAAMLVVVAAGGVQSVLLMAGRSVWQLGNKCCALLVALALNLALIPVWGLIGAALAWSAALLTDVGLALWQITTKLNVRLNLRLVLGCGALSGGWAAFSGALTAGVWGSSLTTLLVHLAVVAPVALLVLARIHRAPWSSSPRDNTQ